MVALSVLGGMQCDSTITLPSYSHLWGMIAFMLLKQECHMYINPGGLQRLHLLFYI